MQHPVTSEYASSRKDVEETLKAIHELNIPTFWFWPNIDAGSDGTSNGIRSFRELKKPSNIHFFKNMEPNDFLCLLKNSQCLIGNSSVGIRECAYLAVTVVNIGTRQHGRNRGGNVVDVGYEKKVIINAIKEQIRNKNIMSENIYGEGDSGVKIANILAETELTFHKKIMY